MNEWNIASGYDIFTGNVYETLPQNQWYGEIHTGNKWLPARNPYCSNTGDTVNEMPLAMIILVTSHTLTCMGHYLSHPSYLRYHCSIDWQETHQTSGGQFLIFPTLSYGKNKADKRDTKDKVQDEHICLSVAFESIKDIHQMGVFCDGYGQGCES